MNSTLYSYEEEENGTETGDPAIVFVLTAELRKEIEDDFFKNEKKVRRVLKSKLIEKDYRLADLPHTLADKITDLAQNLYVMMLRKGITDSVGLAGRWGSNMSNPEANLRRTEVGGFRDVIQDVFLDDIHPWELEDELDAGLGYGGEARISPKNWVRPINENVVHRLEQLAELQAKLEAKPGGENLLTVYSMVKTEGMAEWLAERICGCSWDKIRNTVRRECRRMGINLDAPEEGSRVRYSKKVQAGRASMKEVAGQKRERKLANKTETEKKSGLPGRLSVEAREEYCKAG